MLSKSVSSLSCVSSYSSPASSCKQAETPVGEGFEIPLGSLWLDPNSQQWHRWSERWLAIRSHALATRQIKGLEQRLQKTETALAKLALKPGQDGQALQEKVDKLLESDRLQQNDCSKLFAVLPCIFIETVQQKSVHSILCSSRF